MLKRSWKQCLRVRTYIHRTATGPAPVPTWGGRGPSGSLSLGHFISGGADARFRCRLALAVVLAPGRGRRTEGSCAHFSCSAQGLLDLKPSAGGLSTCWICAGETSALAHCSVSEGNVGFPWPVLTLQPPRRPRACSLGTQHLYRDQPELIILSVGQLQTLGVRTGRRLLP